jgi:hypothetical protein
MNIYFDETTEINFSIEVVWKTMRRNAHYVNNILLKTVTAENNFAQ